MMFWQRHFRWKRIWYIGSNLSFGRITTTNNSLLFASMESYYVFIYEINGMQVILMHACELWEFFYTLWITKRYAFSFVEFMPFVLCWWCMCFTTHGVSFKDKYICYLNKIICLNHVLKNR
jgi:hypothetical protein